MPTIEERLAFVQQELNSAGREASFCEDRGFGGGNPEPYRASIAKEFQEEPQLQRVLPALWRDFEADYRSFFSRSDGLHELDFQFARAALKPSHTTAATWIRTPLQVHAWDEGTYILRQTPGTALDGPFLYLLIGAEKALLVDTGAPIAEGSYWPYLIGSTVTGLIERYRAFHGLPSPELLVTHTHWSDRTVAGDTAFTNIFAPVAGPLDLGGRRVTVLDTSGHCEADYSFYDDRAEWLLSGSIFFPGRIQVKHWQEYRASISRLVQFTALNPVTAILGSQLDHPNECDLALSREELMELNDLCRVMGDRPTRTVRSKFILEPQS